MQHIRKILVGVDLAYRDQVAASPYSDTSLHAIEQGFTLAEQLRATLTFLIALDIDEQMQFLDESDSWEASASALQQQALGSVRELVQRAEQNQIPAVGQVVFGRPAVRLMQHVQETGQDLVIVGTRWQTAAERLLFGSTGMRLLRYCPCPVWVTKSSPLPEDSVLDILVACDFSDTSRQMLSWAITAARLLRGRIHLVHVIQDRYRLQLLHAGVSGDKLRELQQRETEAARRRLRELVEPTDHRTLQFGIVPVVLFGQVESQLLDYIQEQQIDLLMLGTQARGGVAGFLLGNTAEQLLPQLPCSVLTCKPADYVCPLKFGE